MQLKILLFYITPRDQSSIETSWPQLSYQIMTMKHNSRLDFSLIVIPWLGLDLDHPLLSHWNVAHKTNVRPLLFFLVESSHWVKHWCCCNKAFNCMLDLIMSSNHYSQVITDVSLSHTLLHVCCHTSLPPCHVKFCTLPHHWPCMPRFHALGF